MDKLKLVLDFFKKYLFWFIFAGTIILVLVCWWMSTASLAKSFLQEQVKIKKKFDEVKAISDDQQHPTKKYIDAIDEIHQKLKGEVLKVWETLYNEQKNNNRWPELLGDNFIKTINDIDQRDPNGKIPEDQRDRYKYVIKNYFRTVLYKIIDYRHPLETAEGVGNNAPPAISQIVGRISGIGRRPATAAENIDWIGTVDWDEADRNHLEEHFNWDKTPDSDVIRLRQEDLWVYKALLEVIQETNNEGTPEKPVIAAHVKRIEWIQIGADAIGSWLAADQSVFRAAVAAGAPINPRDARTAPSRDAATAQDSKEQLLKERYVDEKGAPLDADENGVKHPYAEFKMMPISMKLHMDQRKISKLLAACVNSPMPIEVRRVRIRPGAGGELLESGTSGGASPAASSSRESNRRTVDARSPSRSTGAAGGGEEIAAGSYDIPVEIQGIIYIYNPPDLNTLGTGTAAEKPAETTPGAAPAAEAGVPGATPEAVPAKPGEAAPAK